MSNKTLLFVFAGLLVTFGLTKIFSGKGERSFKPEIVEVDTAKVTSVVIHAKADSLEEIVLTKEKTGWTVTKESLTVPAEPEAVQQLLSGLALVKATSIAAKNEDNWSEYELEKDKATHLKVLDGNKTLADFFVGKFSVNQMQRQITSYFRRENDDNVYAVEGMGGMMLGQGFDAYRSKAFLFFDNIHAIDGLKYEGPENYTVQKMKGQWLLDGSEALDSAKVRDFLINLRQMKGDEFAKGFDPEQESGNLYKTLTVSGSNLPQPVVVRCWQDTTWEKPFVLQSSQFPQCFFRSDTTRIYKRVFKPVSEW